MMPVLILKTRYEPSCLSAKAISVKDIPVCLSFHLSSTLDFSAHSTLCTKKPALNMHEKPAPMYILFRQWP